MEYHPIESFVVGVGQGYRAVQPLPYSGFQLPLTPGEFAASQRGYQAVQPSFPSGAWGIAAQVFNNGSLVPTTFPGGGVPVSAFPQQPTLDSLIPQKVDAFFKQYVQPNMGSNQWARLIALKAFQPGQPISASSPYTKCYAKSGMGVPCPQLPLTPEEFDARFSGSIKLFNTNQRGYVRPPTTVAYSGVYGAPEGEAPPEETDGTVGQGYLPTPGLPAAAIKKTFMFQVFTGTKLITSTSAEHLNDIEALKRRKQLFDQFAQCTVKPFMLPGLEPQYWECYTYPGPGTSGVTSGVRVYLWDGSKWNFVIWNVNHWQHINRYVIQDESGGSIYR